MKILLPAGRSPNWLFQRNLRWRRTSGLGCPTKLHEWRNLLAILASIS